MTIRIIQILCNYCFCLLFFSEFSYSCCSRQPISSVIITTSCVFFCQCFHVNLRSTLSFKDKPSSKDIFYVIFQHNWNHVQTSQLFHIVMKIYIDLTKNNIKCNSDSTSTFTIILKDKNENLH